MTEPESHDEVSEDRTPLPDVPPALVKQLRWVAAFLLLTVGPLLFITVYRVVQVGTLPKDGQTGVVRWFAFLAAGVLILVHSAYLLLAARRFARPAGPGQERLLAGIHALGTGFLLQALVTVGLLLWIAFTQSGSLPR